MHPTWQGATGAAGFGTGAGEYTPGKRRGRMSGDVRPLFLSAIRSVDRSAPRAATHPAFVGSIEVGWPTPREVRNRGDPVVPEGRRHGRLPQAASQSDATGHSGPNVRRVPAERNPQGVSTSPFRLLARSMRPLVPPVARGAGTTAGGEDAGARKIGCDDGGGARYAGGAGAVARPVGGKGIAGRRFGVGGRCKMRGGGLPLRPPSPSRFRQGARGSSEPWRFGSTGRGSPGRQAPPWWWWPPP